MENPRCPLIPSRFLGKPTFQVLYYFIYYSAFKLDFIQLSLSIHYQYVLFVRMFSKWVEDFPCCEANACAMTK